METVLDIDRIEEQSESTAVVTYNDLSKLLPDPEKVAQRAELTKKMLASLCKVVSPINITDFGGRPYFDHIACERIARIVGLVVKINEHNGRIAYEKVVEDERTNHYTIYLTGKIYYAGREQDYEIQEGSSNSFDDWFSQWQTVDWQEYQDKDGNIKKRKIVTSANLVPESKVREKTRANLIQRLVKKFLGLDFTWEELESAGIDKSKVKGFNFSGSGTATDSPEVLELKKEIWNMITEMCNGNTELAKKTLQKHTAFGDFAGYTDINKVKEKPLQILQGKVQKAYQNYLDKIAEGNKNVTND